MPRSIVLFGATGHTGRLVAERLSATGADLLLVGRDADRTAELAGSLGGLAHATADARRPGSLAELVTPGSVLVSTVGPFARWGEAAVSAAIARGAAYLDSTGEPAFIASVFARDSDARRTGARLIPALGYDYVPGALAGALALRDAGDAAVRVEIGYFTPGRGAGAGLSRGTRLSAAGTVLDASLAFRDGRLRRVAAGERARRFRVDGVSRPALSVSGAEHFGLPAEHPDLREVNVYVGWFGAATPWLRAASRALSRLAAAPDRQRWATRLAQRLADRPTDVSTEDAGRSLAIASAHDTRGRMLARVAVSGPEPYALTAGLMAWAARTASRDGIRACGSLGPVQAFGLGALQAGCAEAGLAVDSAL